MVNKKTGLASFAMGFVICPCPIHGTALGLALLGTTGLLSLLKKKNSPQVENPTGECK